MDLRVVGIVKPDEQYKKNLKAWEALTEAGIEIPEQLLEYFNDEEPDGKGIIIPLKGILKDFKGTYLEGFDINISELVKNFPQVQIIRIYNDFD
jgi:hypothetical protein